MLRKSPGKQFKAINSDRSHLKLVDQKLCVCARSKDVVQRQRIEWTNETNNTERRLTDNDSQRFAHNKLSLAKENKMLNGI